MKKIRTLPTILGLSLILVGTIAGIILTQKEVRWWLRAGETALAPQQVTVTNIADKNFTVSWTTNNAAVGAVKFGTSPSFANTAQDDRDKLSSQTKTYFLHHVTIGGASAPLQPNRQYFFEILVDDKSYGNPATNKPYTVTTGPDFDQNHPLPPNDVAYGIIKDTQDLPPQEAIVYLSLANGVRQSALVKNSGSWIVPLNLIRATNLTDYVQYDSEISLEEIFVQAGPQGTATAVTTTKNDSPVPAIELGKTHDFRNPAEIPPSTGQTRPPSNGFSLETIPPSIPNQAQLRIINPTQGEAVTTTKPQIMGTGPAGESLTVVIESPSVYSDQIIIDEKGSWFWTPPADLEPGRHTVTAALANGLKISQTFTVLAAEGEDLPAFTATPSATLTPTAIPTATPTPNGRTGLPATDGGIPQPGYLTPTWVASIVGMTLVTLGFLIVF